MPFFEKTRTLTGEASLGETGVRKASRTTEKELRDALAYSAAVNSTASASKSSTNAPCPPML